RSRHLERDTPAFAFGAHRHDAADAVDVALHEVAAEALIQAHRPLEIDGIAHAQAAETCAAHRLGHDVGGGAGLGHQGRGEAAAVDRDAVALARIALPAGRADLETQPLTARLDRDDRAH